MTQRLITPDARGRVVLGRITKPLADHYLGDVDEHGIIRLVPAYVEIATGTQNETTNP